MEKENNIYINCWKKTIEWLITANQLVYETANEKYTLSKKCNDIRELASKQLKLLDETKPNKNKSMYSQANEIQKEYIDYLEKVILYGNLDGKDNISK